MMNKKSSESVLRHPHLSVSSHLILLRRQNKTVIFPSASIHSASAYLISFPLHFPQLVPEPPRFPNRRQTQLSPGLPNLRSSATVALGTLFFFP